MNDTGSCHRGRIAFEPETETPIAKVHDCNRAMCRRRGAPRTVDAASR